MKKTLLPLIFIGLVTSLWAQYNHDYCPCQEEESPFDVGKILQQTSTENNQPIIPGYIGFTASTTESLIIEETIFEIEEKPERINLSITLEEMLEQMQVEKEEAEETDFIIEESEEFSEDPKEHEVDFEDEDYDLEDNGDENNDDFIDFRKRKKKRGFVKLKSPKRTKKYSGKCPKFW